MKDRRAARAEAHLFRHVHALGSSEQQVSGQMLFEARVLVVAVVLDGCDISPRALVRSERGIRIGLLERTAGEGRRRNRTVWLTGPTS